ncbi:MAG: hypothetical protein ACI85Q_000036 [Salibacteraceae bacterium]|jgi:hypothetical protein
MNDSKLSRLTAISKLLDNSFELAFIVYLLSGIFKGIYLSKNWLINFDLTLFSGLFLSFLIARNVILGKLANSKLNWNRLWRISPLLIFYLVSIISLYYSPSENYGLFKLFLFSTNILAIISPKFSIKFNLRKFVNMLAIASILVGGYSIIVYGFYFGVKENILGHTLKFYRGFYLDAGYILGLSSILILKLENRFKKAAFLNIILICLWGTAARGPIIFTVISLMIYLSALFIDYGTQNSFKYLFQRKKIILSLLLINTLLIFSVSQNKFGSIILKRTLYRFSVIVPSNLDQTIMSAMDHSSEGGIDRQFEDEHHHPEQSNIDRIDHLIYSWNMINQSWNSRLFGHGIGSYGIIKTGKDIRLYPHNIFLEIWFETGLIGLVPFLFFLISALLWTLKNNQQVLGIAILYLLVNTFKSYSLVDHRILMGIIGISIFIQAKEPAFKWMIINKHNAKLK